MSALGEPVLEQGLPTEWMGCFDAAMTLAEAKQQLVKIVEAVETIGAKIVDVRFGNVLKYQGGFYDNRLNNKCVLKITKRNVDEPVFSSEQGSQLVRFLSRKACDA